MQIIIYRLHQRFTFFTVIDIFVLFGNLYIYNNIMYFTIVCFSLLIRVHEDYYLLFTY